MRLNTGLRAMIVLAALTMTAVPATAIDIVFDYTFDTGGFFATPANQIRRDRLDQAAAVFEGFLDELTPISSGGVNSWQAVIERPDTGNQDSIADLTVPANTVIVYAGARDIGILGIGGPGGFGATGTQAFLDNLSTRGQGQTTGSSATDFGPWGGSITFDSAGPDLELRQYEPNCGTRRLPLGRDP